MECYACFHDLMHQYHGEDYNATEESVKYIEAYQQLDDPVIECQLCGARKKYIPQENGKWKAVLLPYSMKEYVKG